MSDLNLSNAFALIIAINEYEHLDKLSGCVPDAMSVAEYLLDKLHIPDDHLLCLFNEKATREGIIDAFRSHLTKNNDIHYSDPIIIYYSGHGDHQPAPAEWHSSDGSTELIMPVDSSYNPTVNYQPDSSYRHGIPDRTLGALIHELYLSKGDNISVIFDCCHSGSATRGKKAKTRYSHDRNAPAIPSNLDDTLVRNASQFQSVPIQGLTATRRSFGKFSSSSQVPSLKTHVLLAACKNTEVAQEVDNPDHSYETRCGIFTYSLLKALQECDLATTSYSGLMRKIQQYAAKLHSVQVESYPEYIIEEQTPQCEGKNQDRLLFRTQFALSRGMIQLDRHSTDSGFQIKAGSASGIQEGTELGVYLGDMSDTAEPFAQLVAKNVTATGATLSFPEGVPPVEIPASAYVVVTKYTGYSVRILVDEQLKLMPTWQDVLNRTNAQRIAIVWSEPHEPADLVLSLTEKGVEVQRSDPSLIQLDPKSIVLDNSLGAEELAQKLGAIVYFHFHLQRQNANSRIKGQVQMKLIKLQQNRGYIRGSSQYVPASSNPIDFFDGCLSTGKVAELDSDPDKRYGLQLTNMSNWPLFAWVLYFNFEDYSIETLYESPSRDENPPLSTGGKVLPVGYGNAGTEPLRVETDTDSSRETGVFMLLVSSTWVDLSQMSQGSIFELKEKGRIRHGGVAIKADSNIWDVLLVGVAITS